MPDWSGRDFKDRGFTVGIGGWAFPPFDEYLVQVDKRFGTFRPVGSGKTALTLALCRALRDKYNLGKP